MIVSTKLPAKHPGNSGAENLNLTQATVGFQAEAGKLCL